MNKNLCYVSCNQKIVTKLPKGKIRIKIHALVRIHFLMSNNIVKKSYTNFFCTNRYAMIKLIELNIVQKLE